MGFSDSEIANFISYRFLAVILLAFPLGIYIKGKPLKPFFIVGALGVPIVAIAIVIAIKYNYHLFLPLLFVFWGFFLLYFKSVPCLILCVTQLSQINHMPFH